MKRIFLITSLWVGLASGTALSQEADQPADPETPVESKDKAVEGDTKEQPPADDVFVPSERISADQEVIFPVDI
jgi:hypothetical protein